MKQRVILLVLLQNKSQIDTCHYHGYFRRAVNMQVIGHFRPVGTASWFKHTAWGRGGIFWKGSEQETQLSMHYPGFPPTPLRCSCSGHQLSLCLQIQCMLFCLPQIPPSVEFNTDGNFFSTNMLLSGLLRRCCCLIAKSYLTLCDPMNYSTQASLIFTVSQSLFRLMSTESGMLSNYFILCCPVLLLLSILPSTSVFSNELALQWDIAHSCFSDFLFFPSFFFVHCWPLLVEFKIFYILQFSILLCIYFTSFMLKLSICLSYFEVEIQPFWILSVSSVTQSCPTLCDPMNCSTPGLSVHHQLPEFTQTHVHWVSDAIQPCHPLSSPSPPAPKPSQHQSLFQWVNSTHEVAKALEYDHLS